MPTLNELLNERRREKDKNCYERANVLAKQIRQTVKGKGFHDKVRCFEDETWYDIKKAKKRFVPTLYET